MQIICLVALLLSGCGSGGTEIATPPPHLSTILPTGKYVGMGGFVMQVNGSGFTTASLVQWNGASRATTFVSSGQLTARIPASDLSTAESASVTVVNPPTGGPSNQLTFKVVPGPGPGAGVIQMISVAMDGSPSDGSSFTPAAINADGRYVVFQSDATTLVPAPFSGFSDIYVRDTCLGAPAGCVPTTTRVSVHSDGTLANGNSRRPAISADGRYVAFDSSASNLVPDDNNGQFGGVSGLADIFVRDTCLGAPAGCVPTTTRASVADDGTESNGGGDSRWPSLGADGRFVAFSSGATNLVAGDTNFGGMIIRDTCLGAPAGCMPSTTRASVHSDGTQDGSGSSGGTISANGRFVAFLSPAENMVSGDTNNELDAFVRDTCFGAPTGCTPGTTRVSIANDGAEGNNRTDTGGPQFISAAGRFVPFSSFASNLVAGDTNGYGDVFLRDTCVGAPTGCAPSTIRVSVAFDDTQGDNGSHQAMPSANKGHLVVFSSLTGNLTPINTLGKHIFLRETCQGEPDGCLTTTILLSKVTDSVQQGNGISDQPAISADGCYVVFRSSSTNLIPGGSNGNGHIYLAKTGFCG